MKLWRNHYVKNGQRTKLRIKPPLENAGSVISNLRYSLRFVFRILWVLYALSEADEVYTQNALAEMWYFPKQTVNSAIAGLVKTGYIRLEQIAGARNSKAVKLTEQGLDVCKRLVNPLALLKMSEEERRMFLELSDKQQRFLRAELDAVYQDEAVDFNAGSKEVQK